MNKKTATHSSEHPSKRLLSVQEAAAYLAISHWSIRNLIHNGTLPAVRIGRRLLLDKNDLDSLVEVHKQQWS